MADPFSAKELQERARNTAWMVENHAPDAEMNVQVQELDRLVSAAVQLKQTQMILRQTQAPAGCSHRTKRRYRCYDCDLTFCKRCIKAHCRAEADTIFQQWGVAIEQLEEALAEREEAIMRGVRGIHYLCGTSEALREIVATLLAENERLREHGLPESVATWNDAAQRTLGRMCEVYRDAKVETRQARAEVERLRATLEPPMPRPFVLQRGADATGISGTGIVAGGVVWPDGVVAIRWYSEWPTSVVFHDRGLESVEAVHGHDGKTLIVFGIVEERE